MEEGPCGDDVNSLVVENSPGRLPCLSEPATRYKIMLNLFGDSTSHANCVNDQTEDFILLMSLEA
jgi:hypothetical protein